MAISYLHLAGLQGLQRAGLQAARIGAHLTLAGEKLTLGVQIGL